MTRLSKAWLGFGMAVLLVLVWGIGWGVFTHVRMDGYVSDVLPVGHIWTDPASGTTYEVLKTETHIRIERGTLSTSAPDGAVYLFVQMRRANLTETSLCSFNLVGPDRVMWSVDTGTLPEEYPFCSNRDQTTEYWMSYLIPESMLDQLVGVTHHYMQWRHNPALALPTPSN